MTIAEQKKGVFCFFWRVMTDQQLLNTILITRRLLVLSIDDQCQLQDKLAFDGERVSESDDKGSYLWTSLTHKSWKKEIYQQIDIDRSRPIVAYIYLCKDIPFECVLDPDWIIGDSSIPSGDSDGTGWAEEGSGAITKGDHNEDDDDNKCTLTGPERLIGRGTTLYKERINT